MICCKVSFKKVFNSEYLKFRIWEKINLIYPCKSLGQLT